MCRRKELRCCVFLGIGLGLLIGQCFESWFLCTCGGAVLIVVGVFGLRRK